MPIQGANLRNLCNLWVVVAFALTACRELGLVEGTPRERYERSLSRSGINRTGLGTQWTEAGRDALARPLDVALPYREAGYFPAERVEAAGFRFRVLRGQRIAVHVSSMSREPARLFLDLYAAGDSSEGPEHLASADSGAFGLEREVDREGEYVVRLQPELLRSLRYSLTIRSSPTLAFPVEGVGNEAVKSQWGADRDGGRRRHEGIDIFAPRGTPVLAAAPGRIADVGENRLGGRVVWLWDAERNQNLYYAHLDLQIAREGQTVEPGDTLGLVGNTGNARTTPPHLHFGIYRRGEGPIDPYPFVFRTPSRLPVLTADSSRIGEWVRVAARRAVLDGSRTAFSPAGDTLETATLMRVMSASGPSYRVVLPDGSKGFVPAGSVQQAAVPTRESLLRLGGRLYEAPLFGAVAMDSLAPGSRVGVLGRFGQYSLARTAEGLVGWVKMN